MADKNTEGPRKKGIYGEEPKYNEMLLPPDEENAAGGIRIPEEFRQNEANPENSQPESDGLEDYENSLAAADPDAGGSVSKPSGGRAGQSNLNNAVVRLLSTVAMVAGAVLLVVNMVANRMPTSELRELYAGSDYISYSFDIADIEDYVITLNVLGDDYSRTIEVHEGQNSGTLTGLLPGTTYSFKVSGNCGFGKTSLISKSITTAGIEPTGAIIGADYTISDSGTVNIGGELRFSDPLELIEEAQLVWLYADGALSGSKALSVENGAFEIEDLRAGGGGLSGEVYTGEVNLYLYCTVNGVRTLFSHSTVHIESEPIILFEAVNIDDGVILRLSAAPMGCRLREIRIYADGYAYDVTIPETAYGNFTQTLSGLRDNRTYTFYCTYKYATAGGEGEEKRERIERRVTARKCDVSCELLSFTDGGNYFNMTFSYRDNAGTVSRIDLAVNDGIRTEVYSEINLGGTVSATSLQFGRAYDCSLRFYIGDCYTEQYLGRFTTDYGATVRASLSVSGDRVRCELAADDPYGYYDNYTISFVSPGDHENVPFIYDENERAYFADISLIDPEMRYKLTVYADSTKPSDMSVYGKVNVVVLEEDVLY